MLGTDQTHSFGTKTALILGVEFIAIPTRGEDKGPLRGDALETVLTELEEKRKKPFNLNEFSRFPTSFHRLLIFVTHTVATIGTTSTGAIDIIAEITRVSEFKSIFSCSFVFPNLITDNSLL